MWRMMAKTEKHKFTKRLQGWLMLMCYRYSKQLAVLLYLFPFLCAAQSLWTCFVISFYGAVRCIEFNWKMLWFTLSRCSLLPRLFTANSYPLGNNNSQCLIKQIFFLLRWLVGKVNRKHSFLLRDELSIVIICKAILLPCWGIFIGSLCL